MAVARGGGGGRGASCPTSPVAGRRGRSRSPRPEAHENQGAVVILPPEAGVGRPNSRGLGKGAVQRQPSRARSFASALGADKGGATPGGGGASGAALESPTGERVIVGVRLRPLLPREQVKVQGGGGAVSAWIEPPNRVILQDPQTKQGRSFDCDFAFDSTDPKSENFADQKLVYEGIGAKIVGHTLDGYNSCLLAYGQTGTGKTYTIVGDYAGIVEEYGLLPRMADRLFAELGRLRKEGSTVHVQASYVEIYNNQLMDLLAASDIGASSAASGAGGPPQQRPPRSGQQAVQRRNNRLVIHTHPDIGVYVENLSELAVHNASEVHKVLVAGARSRHTAKTSMNDRSSRSHTVFSLKVELRNVGEAGRNRMATAQVVDLAGRENEQSTEVTGERLKELSFINQSLFQLANCISALTKSSRDHIPFRDSKLTMLVSESFQRNSRTCLLAALTPAPSGYDENLLTCRFLESARRIVTKPYVNEFSSEDLRGKLQEEVQRIQKQLGSFDSDAELLSRQAMLQHVSKSWMEYEDAMSRFLADQPDQSTAEAMREAMLHDVCAAVGRSLDGATTAVKSLETRQSAIGASLGKAESQLSAVEARVQKLRQKRGFSVPAKDRVKLPPVPPSDAAQVASRSAGSAPSVTVSVSLPPIVMLH